jgi:hypothetical protein
MTSNLYSRSASNRDAKGPYNTHLQHQVNSSEMTSNLGSQTLNGRSCLDDSKKSRSKELLENIMEITASHVNELNNQIK